MLVYLFLYLKCIYFFKSSIQKNDKFSRGFFLVDFGMRMPWMNFVLNSRVYNNIDDND